jgi:hypothetical protein
VTANPLFPTSLYNLLDFELYVLVVNFLILCYLFYKFFLKNVSAERHESLKNQLKSLLRQVMILSILFALYTGRSSATFS